MKRTLCNEIKAHLGKEILIQGWVQEVRNLNKIKFVIVRDRTGFVQCIALQKDTAPEVFSMIDSLANESVIELIGTPKENKQSRLGYEVAVKKINVLSESEKVLPIDTSSKSNTLLDKRLDFRFLDTRRPEIMAVFKIRSVIHKATVEYFESNGFTNINTPKLTVLGMESGADLFTVKYFGKPVYLAQSPQLYKQMFVMGGFERVYEIAPVFRAEKSNTLRHQTEFTGIDFEMGFINDENDVMDVVEGMMKHILKQVKSECGDELTLLGVELEIPNAIPRVPIQEIRTLLKEKGKSIPENEDLDIEAEKLIGEIIKKKFKSDFVFATNYPFAKRPFYHMKSDNGTRSFDLLYKGVEIATGSQREHRYGILEKQAKEKGLDLTAMPEYASLFKYGAPPHGGTGLGLDRLAQRLLGFENVREAILLPRDPVRYKP